MCSTALCEPRAVGHSSLVVGCADTCCSPVLPCSVCNHPVHGDAPECNLALALNSPLLPPPFNYTVQSKVWRAVLEFLCDCCDLPACRGQLFYGRNVFLSSLLSSLCDGVSRVSFLPSKNKPPIF